MTDRAQAVPDATSSSHDIQTDTDTDTVTDTSISLESLPVELIADVLSELDLPSLVKVAYLSRRLHHISSDPSLNPWRQPILRALRCNSVARGKAGEYDLPLPLPLGVKADDESDVSEEDVLRTLSVRAVVPRRNWVEILSLARPEFLVFQATLPHMADREWRECFSRRFLPSWVKWRKDECRWREAFVKMLSRLSHRGQTGCTIEEAWTKYIVLNRNGSANQHDGQSRNFSPLAIFNEMKLQSNLAHLETHIRLVVQFTDVRILALGVLHRPRNQFMINSNARALLHPDGIDKADTDIDTMSILSAGNASSVTAVSPTGGSAEASYAKKVYEPMMYPQPAASHALYPYFTPGGGDKRWLGSGGFEEQGQQWVGGLMLVAQLLTPETCTPHEVPALQDLDLVIGPGRTRYASFTWADLAAIAPWMEDKITKKIDGPGLGV